MVYIPGTYGILLFFFSLVNIDREYGYNSDLQLAFFSCFAERKKEKKKKKRNRRQRKLCAYFSPVSDVASNK
jgi:hypothetical protein